MGIFISIGQWQRLARASDLTKTQRLVGHNFLDPPLVCVLHTHIHTICIVCLSSVHDKLFCLCPDILMWLTQWTECYTLHCVINCTLYYVYFYFFLTHLGLKKWLWTSKVNRLVYQEHLWLVRDENCSLIFFSLMFCEHCFLGVYYILEDPTHWPQVNCLRL